MIKKEEEYFEGKSFGKIVHISDIHIRLSSRFDEYESVLKRFVECLHLYDDAIVVITGDIFHHKNELTPNCVMFAVSFFRRIAKVHPLIIIPGNHDFLMNNLDKEDSITSVLYRRNMKNVFYLKESGIYRFGNLLFVHNSLWNPNQNPWISTLSIKKQHENDMIVSLYHGMVGKCQTLSGYTFDDSETLSPSHFDGSDFVLLGDIHHHQYIQKNMAYAGSMISQNFNETDDQHGFILWDICERMSSFHKLQNDYAYRRVDIFPKDSVYMYLNESYDSICPIVEQIQKSMRVEIHIHDDDTYDTIQIRKVFESKGIHPKIRYNHTSIDISFNTTLGLESNNIHNPYSLQTLLDEFLKDNPKLIGNICLKKSIVDTIVENVSAFQHKVQGHSFAEMDSWKLLEISFDHMFGYGQENRVIFENHMSPQLVGIFGENSVGKSTLIDIILFMLYGRITRYASGNSVPQELIHEKQQQFCGQLRFQLGDNIYTIKKNGKRNKKTGKIKIVEELWKQDINGLNMNMTEEHRMKTDKMIGDLIGPIDQFMYMSLCTQTPSKSFREMTQKERKEFLFLLFGLDSFEKFHGDINNEMKKLEVEEKTMMTIQESSDFVMEKDWENQIRALEKELCEIKDNILHTNEILQKLQKKNKKFLDYQSQCRLLTNCILNHEQQISMLEDRLSTMNIDDIVEEIDIENTQMELQTQRTHLQRIRDELKSLRKEWKPLPPIPSCPHFSYRRWIVLTRLWRDDDFPNQFNKKVGMLGNVEIPDDFSFFESPHIHAKLEKMEEMNRQRIPDILDRFNRIVSYQSRKLDAESRICGMEEEFQLHEHVEYNDHCEMCRSNPFRKRKTTLTIRLKKYRKEILNIHQKILYEKTNIAKEIMECLSHFININRYSAEETAKEWSERLFKEEWESISIKLRKRESFLNDFRSCLENMLRKKFDDIKNIERKEYGDFTQYLKQLNDFVKVKTSNRMIDSREKVLLKEMETIEPICTKLEQTISNLVIILEKKRLRMDVKTLIDKKTNDLIERAKIEKKLQNYGNLDQKIRENQQDVLHLSKRESVTEKDLEMARMSYQRWRINAEKLKEIRRKLETRRGIVNICHRGGFPSYILRKLIPKFGEYMNRILNHFTERYVQFCVDEDGDVIFNTKSHDSEMVFHFYGGMESLMIDLATKITFAHFAYCPMSSFFVLDENISVLDEYHLQHIEILFSFLKQHFQHILLISHISSVKNIVDSDIQIVKLDGYSTIDCKV